MPGRPDVPLTGKLKLQFAPPPIDTLVLAFFIQIILSVQKIWLEAIAPSFPFDNRAKANAVELVIAVAWGTRACLSAAVGQVLAHA